MIPWIIMRKKWDNPWTSTTNGGFCRWRTTTILDLLSQWFGLISLCEIHKSWASGSNRKAMQPHLPPARRRCFAKTQSLQVRNGPGNPAKPDESMGFNGDLMTYNGIYWSFSDVMVIFDGIFQGRSNFLKTNKIMGDFRWFEQQERAGLKNVGSCKRWETSSFFVCEITIQWPLNRHLSPSNLQKSPSKSQW